MNEGKTNMAATTADRVKPEIVTIGNREITSHGLWNNAVLADWLMLNAQRKWISIGELAKIAWHQNTLTTKKRARRNLSRLWHYLLVERGRLLVVEYETDGHHRAQAVKLYDPQAPHEREIIELRLARMTKNKELTEDRYQRAIGLLSLPNDEAEGAV